MRIRSTHIPGLTKHRASGQAVVRLDGKDHYLGRYGSAEAKSAYEPLIAEWLAPSSEEGPEVGDVLLGYTDLIKGYYKKPDGTPTSEVYRNLRVLKIVRGLYARTPARTFSPLCLKAVRFPG